MLAPGAAYLLPQSILHLWQPKTACETNKLEV